MFLEVRGRIFEVRQRLQLQKLQVQAKVGYLGWFENTYSAWLGVYVILLCSEKKFLQARDLAKIL